MILVDVILFTITANIFWMGFTYGVDEENVGQMIGCASLGLLCNVCAIAFATHLFQ